MITAWVLFGLLIFVGVALIALVFIGIKYCGGTWDKGNCFTEDVEMVAQKMLADKTYIPPLKPGLKLVRAAGGRASVISE